MTPKSLQRLLYLMTLLFEFSATLLVFTVSRSLAQADAGLLQMGIVGSVFSLVMGLFSVLAGRLSDRFGCRRMIATGQVLLLLGAIGCALTGPQEMLRYLSYWLSGMAMGMFYAPVYAWISSTNNHNTHQPARGIGRTIILYCLMWNLGLVAGQTTGGWLFVISPYWPIYLAIVLAIVNLGLLGSVGKFMVGRASRPSSAGTADPPPQSGVSRQSLALAGRPTVIATTASNQTLPQDVGHQTLSAAFAKLSWLANLGGAFSMSMIFHLMPSLFEKFHIPPQQHGFMLAVMRVQVVATYLVLHRLNFWHMRLWPAMVLHLLAIAGMTAISLAPQIVWLQRPLGLTLCLTTLALFQGFNYFASLYYTTRGSSQEKRGAASGMHEGMVAIGLAAGSFFGGLAGHLGASGTPYRLGAAVILIMAIIQIIAYQLQVRPLLQAQQALSHHL